MFSSVCQTLVSKLFNDKQNQKIEKDNAPKQKSIETVQQSSSTVRIDRQISVDSQNIDLRNQIESLQCLFTWGVKSQGNQDMITCIKNKYGDVNLDISLPVFTFVRFIGNLIISHELYLNGDSDASDMKIFEIGKWLDQLDKTTDEFYLSINIALKHIMAANFVFILFATNENTGFNVLLDEIVPYDIMNNKLKAAVNTIHAAILMEYGNGQEDHKYAKLACSLDPDSSHWWHIYACVLAKGQVLSRKNLSLKNETIKTVKRAVLTSDITNISSVDSFVLTTLNQVMTNERRTSVFESINNSKYSTTNKARSNLKTEMKTLVMKHKNGEDVLPYLNDLILKFNHDKWKIIAEICAYTVLFRNKFRVGIELFLVLIKEPSILTRDYIKCRSSIFIDDSKMFNLAELIWNEIILAITNSRDISSQNILFYYKVFIEIKETNNLKMRVVEPDMRINLIGLSGRSKCSQKTTTNNSPKKKIFFNHDNITQDNTRNNFRMPAGLENYGESENTLAYSQQSTNFFNEIQNLSKYNYFGDYECLSSSSVIENKMNLFFQSIIQLNSSTTSKISLIDIDISLSEFSRSNTSSTVYKKHLFKILSKYPDSFKIYTDASRIQNKVGIAIVSAKECFSYKLSSDYTSNDAEAVAILRAIDYALTENLNEYVILSDSLSTIKSIKNKFVNSDIIHSILCLIHALHLKRNSVHFVWIPSHKLIDGNEKADKLAREIAVSTTVITYTHNSYIPSN